MGRDAVARTLLAVALSAAFRADAVAQTQPAAVATPLTYDAALTLAMSRNLHVEAARRQRAIREAAIRTARLVPNPVMSFSTGRDAPYQIFGIDVPVEIGAKRSRRIDVATEELTLADLDVQTELRGVRRDLRQAFFSLVAADDRVRIATDVRDIAQRLRDAAQARFDTGAAPRLEVLQAELGVTRAETDLDLAASIRTAEQANLNAVLNLSPDQPLTLAGSLSDQRSAITYQQALAMATTTNTDLVGLDRQIAVEQRRVDLLRAERVPTPVFSLEGLFNSPGEFDVGPRATVSVELPIFSRNQGEIAGSVATAAALRIKRDATLRSVENDVFGTFAKIEAERRQVDAYEQRLVATATNLESLAEESYRAGRTSVLGVLDAQRNLRDIRRDALQAALDLQLSLADLEELLGTPLP